MSGNISRKPAKLAFVDIVVDINFAVAIRQFSRYLQALPATVCPGKSQAGSEEDQSPSSPAVGNQILVHPRKQPSLQEDQAPEKLLEICQLLVFKELSQLSTTPLIPPIPSQSHLPYTINTSVRFLALSPLHNGTNWR